MRRAVIFSGTVLAVLAVSSPSYAFAHNAVTNPVWHAVLDVLTLAVVTAPLWTAYAWGGRRRGALLALIGLVQVPVAVIGFVPIANPVLHTVLFTFALAVTIASIVSVRRFSLVAQEAPIRAGR
jgi:hypothetical protein